MPTDRTFHRSFSGGEMSPDMYGRVDDVRFQTGVARLSNFLSKPHGPARSRPGLRFVKGAKFNAKKSRVIPFIYSIDQTVVIEIGEGYFRFFVNGAALQYPVPGDYVINRTAPPQAGVDPGTSGIDTVNNIIVFAVDHNFQVGERIAITGDNAATAPGGITYWDSNEQFYYVAQVTSSKGIKISATLGGPVLNITSIGGGTPGPDQHRVHRAYAVGDIVDFLGDWQCLQIPISGSPGSYVSEAPAPGAYWRQLSGDGTYELPNTFLESELFAIDYAQSGDVMTLVHPAHRPAELRRESATVWQFVDITFGSELPAPTGLTTGPNIKLGTLNAFTSMTVGAPSNITCNYPHGLAKGDTIYVENVTWPYAGGFGGWYVVTELPSSTTFRCRSYIGIAATAEVANPGPTTAITGDFYVGELHSEIGETYKVTAVDENGVESAASAQFTGLIRMASPGAVQSLTWTAVAGAVRYRIYKLRGGGLYGLVGESDTNVFDDDNIAPDMGVTLPKLDTTLDGTDYPSAVGYFEQRRCFAGSPAAPQKIWMTRSGTESDLSFHLPLQAADRIQFELASLQATAIRFIVPMDHLLLLTSDAEYRVTPLNSDALVPDSISARPQSYVGSSTVRPVLVNNTLLYCAARGGHVRELGYQASVQGFVTGDVSLRAAHLFDDLEIIDLAFAKAPTPIVWCVSSNGKLLGLTYIPDQQVGGWHQHETEGEIESVCVVAEGAEDIVYVVVKRSVNGSDVRNIERMAPLAIGSIDTVVCSDSAVSYDGAPATVIRNITHLEGETVTVLADGQPVGEQVVARPAAFAVTFDDVNDEIDCAAAHGLLDGEHVQFTGAGLPTEIVAGQIYYAVIVDPLTFQIEAYPGRGVIDFSAGTASTAQGAGRITLQAAASKVVVGLPYDCELQTLPMALQIPGLGQGRQKNVIQASVRVADSASFEAGPALDDMTPSDAYVEGAETLQSFVQAITLPPSWGDEGQIYLRQSNPLPVTVVSIALVVAIGGS